MAEDGVPGACVESTLSGSARCVRGRAGCEISHWPTMTSPLSWSPCGSQLCTGTSRGYVLTSSAAIVAVWFVLMTGSTRPALRACICVVAEKRKMAVWMLLAA